jgi:hypothetical protein
VRKPQSVNLNALDNSCQPTQNQFRKDWRAACTHPAVETPDNHPTRICTGKAARTLINIQKNLLGGLIVSDGKG